MEKFNADRIVTINVDVQNDFCPGGSLAVAEGDQVVAPLNELNDFTRQNGGTVVFTGDQHPDKTPHFDIWPVHCVAGTEGAALREDLIVLEADTIVSKGTGQTDGYSAFEGLTTDGRELAEVIKPINRERVAVLMGGLATDYCVLNSALDAVKVEQGDGEIRVYVIREAIRGVNINADDSEKAIEAMATAGVTIVETVKAMKELL
ncbi:MAG: isochorismatase family protein [Candidatus Saccharimonadaceae bacterium]